MPTRLRLRRRRWRGSCRPGAALLGRLDGGATAGGRHRRACWAGRAAVRVAVAERGETRTGSIHMCSASPASVVAVCLARWKPLALVLHIRRAGRPQALPGGATIMEAAAKCHVVGARGTGGGSMRSKPAEHSFQAGPPAALPSPLAIRSNTIVRSATAPATPAQRWRRTAMSRLAAGAGTPLAPGSVWAKAK